jgi:hypothetical protein
VKTRLVLEQTLSKHMAVAVAVLIAIPQGY